MSEGSASSRGDSVCTMSEEAEFCSITGVTRTEASHFLSACSNHLPTALSLFFDGENGRKGGGGGGGVGGGRDTGKSSQKGVVACEADAQDAENVRAPIPQKQEVLVPPSLYPVPKRRKISHSVFDGFRDFQSESAMAAVSASGGFSGGGVTGERRSLADLFRPPVELIHRGGFMSARLAAEQRHCWLLVNIQDASDFSSQCLNRDVWSASSVKEALKEHFVFWQVYRDTEEGERFCQFYKVSSLPHISILEPATGEKLAEFVASDPTTFLDLATDFLSHHDLADARSSAAPVQVDTSCDKSASSFTKSKWEDVKCTMSDCVPREECSGNSAEVGVGSKDVWRNIEEDKADVGDVKTTAVKSGGCITLRLRYPDDSREQKSFLSSAPLQELFSHVTLRGFPLSRFDIVGTFPALRVSAICPRSPLSASLYHNHTLFIHEKLS